MFKRSEHDQLAALLQDGVKSIILDPNPTSMTQVGSVLQYIKQVGGINDKQVGSLLGNVQDIGYKIRFRSDRDQV